MALPASGQISINQVNVELGVAGTTQRSFNDAVVRTLFAVASGAISMSNGFGKSNAPAVTPGSQNYTTPGTYTFTVPAFNTLTVNVWGGGGAGNRSIGQPSATTDNPGGTSSFSSYLSATGGSAAVYVGPDGNGTYVTPDTNAGTSVDGATLVAPVPVAAVPVFASPASMLLSYPAVVESSTDRNNGEAPTRMFFEFPTFCAICYFSFIS
jgi:hypothetical protein